MYARTGEIPLAMFNEQGHRVLDLHMGGGQGGGRARGRFLQVAPGGGGFSLLVEYSYVKGNSKL